MCGITGAIWNDPAAALDGAALARMADRLAHRGPDDAGQFTSDCRLESAAGSAPGVALAYRRLAIIDPAGSRQPLSNEDGSIRAVFNGEIYNYRELRGRLEAAGHRFQTAGDAEVIVHLYEDEGEGFLPRLWGMFALAIWDLHRGLLLLARDRLGKKPLVYRAEPNRLLFASELKALLAAPNVPRDVDPQAIDAYLAYQYVPQPRTIFRGINKLPPGHRAVWREGRLRVEPYWWPDFGREIDRPYDDYEAELRALLTDSVRLRLQSDAPLGAFLSGGVDSSIVVGLMSRLARGGQGGRVKTFSIGFSEPRLDESRWARQVARFHGCEHFEQRIDATAIDVLPKLARHFDEPFGDSSALPTYLVSQLARREVKVALTGDGGDELFAGYDRYRAVQLAAMIDRLPAAVRRAMTAQRLRRLADTAAHGSLRRRIGRFAAALALPPVERYARWVGVFDAAAREALWSDSFRASLGDSRPLEFLEYDWFRSAARDAVTAASLADLVTYLPGDLLHKVDMASMAHGLECRQPFLDHRLVELAAAMPVHYKLHRGVGKRILRSTFADLLPPAVRRRPKMGFGVPLETWLRTDWREMVRDTLLGPTARARGIFRAEAVARLVDEHQSATRNHAHQLWALLMLELWYRQWVDQK